jgi:hypothetical protein
MHSLRDMGYDLPSAVADLVDNSIDAGGRRVEIVLGTDWRGSYLLVADDGHGMSERQLDEAMRYGSRRAYGDRDLGYFGLGLKTASLSQCRRLTVATRSTPRGRTRIRRWDLDNVADWDEWLLERPRALDCRPQLTDPLRESPGTVVMWENLDRVLGRRRVDGDAAQRRVHAAVEELRLHLGMVFHRYLSGEVRARRLRISLNGEQVPPWDPFARDEPLAQQLPTQRLRLSDDDGAATVFVTPHILPNQHHFSSLEAHAAASGPNLWNRQQGLYIYRRDRLVQSGGWSRLRTIDEHSKLARVAVDIPPGADEAFRINVAKMTVGLPDSLRPQLRVLIAGVVTRAQDVYRQRVRLVPDDPETGYRHDGDSESTVLGDNWASIVAVLEHELREHPELLDKVLLALINTRAQAVDPSVEPPADRIAG